ncbi:MAG: tail fiber protein [Pseudomonadota bacterium]
MEPILGQVILFAGNFAPRGWAFCDGQTLEIAENEPLYAILGTTYGGDGQTTFCLPDLRGRTAVHAGHGDGLSPRDLGQSFGAETVALSATELPEHRHEIYAADGAPSGETQSGAALSTATTVVSAEAGSHRQRAEPATQLHSKTVGLAGGSAPHQNMQPSLGMNYIIAVQGSFPARN